MPPALAHKRSREEDQDKRSVHRHLHRVVSAAAAVRLKATAGWTRCAAAGSANAARWPPHPHRRGASNACVQPRELFPAAGGEKLVVALAAGAQERRQVEN